MKELEVADIRIVFEDDRPEVKLKPPTADIAFAINRQVGGFRNLLDRINAADFDVYEAVLESCTDIPAGDNGNGLRDFIWKNAGEVHLACMHYCFALMNGGKSMDQVVAEREAAGESEDDDEPESEDEAKKD